MLALVYEIWGGGVQTIMGVASKCFKIVYILHMAFGKGRDSIQRVDVLTCLDAGRKCIHFECVPVHL